MSVDENFRKMMGAIIVSIVALMYLILYMAIKFCCNKSEEPGHAKLKEGQKAFITKSGVIKIKDRNNNVVDSSRTDEHKSLISYLNLSKVKTTGWFWIYLRFLR